MVDLPRVPIGDWVESGVDWLTDNATWIFRLIRDVLGWLIDHLEDLLLWPDALILIALFGLLAWWVRGLPFAVFTVLAFGLVESMGHWAPTMATLALVVTAAAIAAMIGVPVGILAARHRMVSAVVRPMLDLMQTLPAFVYLIPAIFFFGVGQVPGAVATIIFAMPPAVRLSELGIRQVDEEVVEAGHAFGASPGHILTRIQLPLALPTIMAGINQVIMLALSMVVIAGIVGAGGAGALVYRGISNLDVGLGFEAGLSIVILAIFLDRTSASLNDRAQRYRDRAAT
jgi:ABC-type proline/glycine betaine transport system permease subunit